MQAQRPEICTINDYGTAKIMSFENFCEAEKQRDLKNIATQTKSRPNHNLHQNSRKRSRSEELIEAADQISDMGLREYCTVFACN